jgi:putative addiction module component (TIGR02574 family)
MTSDTRRLLDEALQLPPEERESLASQLFESLEADDPDASQAWADELERRIAELDHGIVKPIPWAQARELIFGGGEQLSGD